MFKILLTFILLFSLTSCFGRGTEKLNNNISSSNSSSVISNENTFETLHGNESLAQVQVENLYSLKVDDKLSQEENFKSYMDWFALYKKDENYFKNQRKDELEFFNIWSDYLYNTNYTNNSCNNLSACIEGKISPSEVKDNFCQLICEGKNEFNVENNENFYIVKNQFIKYKQNLEGKDTKIEAIDDYFVGNIFKGKYTEQTLLEDYFYFSRAASLNKCNELKDSTLALLCDDYVKRNN